MRSGLFFFGFVKPAPPLRFHGRARIPLGRALGSAIKISRIGRHMDAEPMTMREPLWNSISPTIRSS